MIPSYARSTTVELAFSQAMEAIYEYRDHPDAVAIAMDVFRMCGGDLWLRPVKGNA